MFFIIIQSCFLSTVLYRCHFIPSRYIRYSILAMTAALMLMSFAVMGRRPASEGFASFWSAVLLCCLSVGGTMIMRKFHNSMAVGFFMGVTVASSQLFGALALVYVGYGSEQAYAVAAASGQGMGDAAASSAKEETLMAVMAAIQAVLLGSFAAILAAHRSEILDKQQDATTTTTTTAATTSEVNAADASASSYAPPISGSSNPDHHRTGKA